MRSFVAALLLCLLCVACLLSRARAEVMVGMASVDFGRVTRWDGGRYHGLVATGERFRANVLAVAHRTLPLHSCVAVKYRDKTVGPAVVDDRGPCLTDHCQRHAPLRVRERVLDLKPRLASALGFPGTGKVTFWPVACR